MVGVAKPPAQRFWPKVDKESSPTGCWLWTASLYDNGYGRFSVAGRMVRAHRWSYEDANGLILPDLEIDHVCHNQDLACPGGVTCPHRACVRPSHLEQVDHGENMQRGRKHGITKTHCPAGHPYDEENTSIDAAGKKRCRTCRNAAARAKRSIG